MTHPALTPHLLRCPDLLGILRIGGLGLNHLQGPHEHEVLLADLSDRRMQDDAAILEGGAQAVGLDSRFEQRDPIHDV